MQIHSFANDWIKMRHVKCPLLGAALILILTSLFSVTTFASPRPPSIEAYLNQPGIENSSSFCYMSTKEDSRVLGQNVKSKVKIASVSKIFTSYFALKTKSPDYRFPTRFYFDRNTRDLFVIGSMDPFMGQRSLQLIISELHRLHINKVRNFVFDDRFAVYLNVEKTGASMWSDRMIPSEVRYGGRSLNGSLKDLKSFMQQGLLDYKENSQRAKFLGLAFSKKIDFSVENFIASEKQLAEPTVNKNNQYLVYEYLSAPLLHYVKSFNSQSNNYVADQLLAAFGGIKAMINFYITDMRFADSDIEFYTGSGLWSNLGDDEASMKSGRKHYSKDNLATCEAVVRVMSALERWVQNYHYRLSDIVMVAGKDAGTLSGLQTYKSTEMKDAVIAKSGTLNNALTLAGEISAEKGKFYFGIFFELKDPWASKTAAQYRDEMMRQFMADIGGGRDPIRYKSNPFFPYDKNSRFRQITLN